MQSLESDLIFIYIMKLISNKIQQLDVNQLKSEIPDI